MNRKLTPKQLRDMAEQLASSKNFNHIVKMSQALNLCTVGNPKMTAELLANTIFEVITALDDGRIRTDSAGDAVLLHCLLMVNADILFHGELKAAMQPTTAGQ
jgi:hypothetical protein